MTSEHFNEYSNTPEERTDNWRVHYGDYRLTVAVDTTVFGSEVDYELTHEGFLDFMTNSFLEERRQKQKNSPVLLPPIMILDFGSTQAHTMAAFVTLHSQAIENGELMVLCSNLAYEPDKEEEEKQYDGDESLQVSDVNEARVPNYYEVVKRIKWLKGRAKDIAKMSVTDEKGRIWPLKGNVSLINESMVLQHVRTDKDSPGVTENEKEARTVANLDSLMAENALLVSLDLHKNLTQLIAHPELMNLRVRMKGDASVRIAEYQKIAVKKITPKIETHLAKLQADLDNNVPLEGYDDMMDSINASREKLIIKLKEVLKFAEEN